MPLTTEAIKKTFGNVQPQELRDYSSNQLIYEGYATPGISTATAGWVIIKHSYTNSLDMASQPKYGIVWDLRVAYDYTIPYAP